jgi:hypothetical protein
LATKGHALWLAGLGAAGLAVLIAPRLPRELDGLARRYKVVAAIWGLFALLTLAQTARLSWFMADHTRVNASVYMTRAGAIHSNLTGYMVATWAARKGGTKVYIRQEVDFPGLVDGAFGPFYVTAYQYPPPFLLLTRVFLFFSHDFFHLRTLWFLFEALVVIAGLLLTARWIGGPAGRRLLWLTPLIWVALSTQVDFQIGNIQIVIIACSMLAMVAFERDRPVLGGALLSFLCVAKIFPGILLLFLVFRRRWREVAWTAAFMLGWSLLTLGVFGVSVFREFLHDHLPRLASGAAFPFLDTAPWTVTTNHSIPGITLKLRALGIPFMSWHAEQWTARVYTFLLIPLTFWVARRQNHATKPLSRLVQARGWLALIHLSAVQSPIVTEPTALFGLLWLHSLFVVDVRWLTPSLIAVGGVVWVLLSVNQPPLDFLFSLNATNLFVLAIQLVGVSLAIAACYTSAESASRETNVR